MNDESTNVILVSVPPECHHSTVSVPPECRLGAIEILVYEYDPQFEGQLIKNIFETHNQRDVKRF